MKPPLWFSFAVAPESTRSVTVKGWCLTSQGQPVVGIRARVGSRVFMGKHGRSSDARIAYPYLPKSAQKSGFSVSFKLPAFARALCLEAATGPEEWVCFFSTTAKASLPLLQSPGEFTNPPVQTALQEAKVPLQTNPARRGPNEPGGIKRVHVGCGPKCLKPDWWNVDLRPFPGIDEAMDVAAHWPFKEIDYVYGEHFIEHLSLDQAIAFLTSAGNALRKGGIIRLSTPALDWVWATHFSLADTDPQKLVMNTLKANCAFHGWGHQFLYTSAFMEALLQALGFETVRFAEYGQSECPDLRNLEEHGGYKISGGFANLVIVEAIRGDRPIGISDEFMEVLKKNFLNRFRGGH